MIDKALRGDRNQCAGCKTYFNSTAAFDKHRTGKFGVDRRCKTEDEMRAAGMDIRADGFWITAHNPTFFVAEPEPHIDGWPLYSAIPPAKEPT